MPTDLSKSLESAARRDALPTVIAYNRIDGPGSSLDLREFQQTLWMLPQLPQAYGADPTMCWSRTLPRTTGITIDTGTRIQARPLERGLIGVQSTEYDTEVVAQPGDVLPIKEHWLLKVVELFDLRGVMFVLHNLRPGMQSAGLGGSATATTGTCILANELAGRPFSPVQLISMASRLEQDFGVSLTGTQEQSNVLYGGITDYVWFPWGIPGRSDTGFGESLRTELIPPGHYPELEKRMALFHSGLTRASTSVNTVWRDALKSPNGYQLHSRKLEIAYRFREALRLSRWDEVCATIEEYRAIRTRLCPEYMAGAHEVHGFAEQYGCVVFPLGAGGGGGILVVGPDPDRIEGMRGKLREAYREISFRVRDRGHEIINLPLT